MSEERGYFSIDGAQDAIHESVAMESSVIASNIYDNIIIREGYVPGSCTSTSLMKEGTRAYYTSKRR